MGPYFKSQKPAACGCYYPEVTRIRDDKATCVRTLFCVTHGEMQVSIRRSEIIAESRTIPDEKWRAEMRRRIQAAAK